MDTFHSPSKRQKLLAHLPWFVRSVTRVEGVLRISVLGSITTDKLKPKDIDFLVMIEDSAELEPLARLGRKLKGRTGSEGDSFFVFDTVDNSRDVKRLHLVARNRGKSFLCESHSSVLTTSELPGFCCR